MASLAKLSQRYAAFSMRERVLAALAVLAIIYMAMDFLWFTPTLAKTKALRESTKLQTAQQDALSAALRDAAAKPKEDPLASLRAERDQLRATVGEAQAVLAKVSPDIRAGEMLRSIAAGNGGVTLVSLKTIPSQSFYNPAARATPAAPAASRAASAASAARMASSAPAPGIAATAPGNIYKHGVEVTVKGSYPALVAYMRAVEQAARGVFWGDIKLDAQYPDSTLKFSLYVLSTQPEMLFE